jgi:protein-disulfide isomerase
MAVILSFSVAVFKRIQDLNQAASTSSLIEYYALLYNDYSPTLGSENALIEIVEFSDFQCPFCAQGAPVVIDLAKQYAGIIKLTYRHFPIANIHPEAWGASIASTCAAEQDKFWEYHDQLFSNQDNFSKDIFYSIASKLGLNSQEFNECYNGEEYGYQVRKDLADGLELDVRGTPTYFINGEIISGLLTRSQWQDLIEAYLIGLQGNQ